MQLSGHVSNLTYPDRETAKKYFLRIVENISVVKKLPVKLFLRDSPGKNLRGQCRVEEDGFYYWIELFITPS